MKKWFVMIFVITIVNILFASDIEVKSELKDVKVFLSGAELVHTVSFEYPAGSNSVIITDLANSINSNSLNIKTDGNYLIIDSKVSRDYLLEKEKSEQIKSLKDSLSYIENEIEILNAAMQVSQAEIDLILANQNLGTDLKSPTVDEIKKMQNFYKSELSKLHKEIIAYKVKTKDWKEFAEKIRKQLAEINGSGGSSTIQIVVTILAEKGGKGSMELKYFTDNVGWNPAYDVRVNDLGEPFTLNQKAMVWQNTGLQWRDKKLTLSTGNPSLRSNLPELYPWTLDFQRNYDRLRKQKGVADELAFAPEPTLAAETISEEVEVVEIVEKMMSHEFVSPLKYTILSDSKEHMVHLKDYSIDAEYTYHAVPKISEDVFLAAKVKDWGNNPIMPGYANIFFENTYIGNTYLSLYDTKAEIKISLGRDSDIAVKREEVKDFSEDKFLSSDIERKFAYKISVKNNKNKPIDIEIEDQLPISKQEDIDVKPINTDGAVYNTESGKLTWKLRLDKGAIAEKSLSFSVRFPGDMKIQGL